MSDIETPLPEVLMSNLTVKYENSGLLKLALEALSIYSVNDKRVHVMVM